MYPSEGPTTARVHQQKSRGESRTALARDYPKLENMFLDPLSYTHKYALMVQGIPH